MIVSAAETGTLKRVMKAFDWQPRKKGCVPVSGQIVGASLVTAPKQRNIEDEKAAIKSGKSAGEIWLDEPAKATQKGCRCPLDTEDRRQGPISARRDTAANDCDAGLRLRSYASIDRRSGFIRGTP